MAENHRPEGVLSASDCRLIVETAAEGIWMIDRDARTTYVNENLSVMLGYSARELLGRTPLAFIPPRERRHAAESFERLSHGVGGQFEFVLERRDGSELFVLVSGNAIYDEAGNFTGGLAIVADITERKRAEELLRESEARLAEAQRIAHIGSWAWDIVEDRVSWSDELLRIYGLEDGEFEGTYEAFLERVHPEDRAMADHVVRTAFETREPFVFDHRIVRPNGDVRTLHATGEVVVGEDGAPVRMDGVGQDITAHKEAEEQLRDSEARFRAMFESAAVGIVLIDPARRILVTNHPFEEMLGYSKVELEGRSFTDLTYPEDEPRSREIVPKLSAGGADTLEKRYVRKDGSLVWVRVTAAPITGPGGEVQSAIGIIEDISERKLAEARLSESQERYKVLVETARDAFVSIDSSGLIIDWNRQAERLFGWSGEEALGHDMAELIMPPRYRAAHQAGLARFLETGEERVMDRTLEFSALDRDGREFAVELMIWPTKAGDAWRFNSFVRDISERKELEEQLRHAQKMEAVGRLAGGVAHDFNNLLLAIRGYTELATAELSASGDHETARASLAQIGKAAERAGSLTRQLLAFSRKQVLVPRVVELNRLIAEDESLLERLVGEDVELRFSFDRKPCNVKVDPGQLQQVIMNIVINARDAMPKGGELVITTKRRRLSSRRAKQEVVLEPGPYVELQIRDSGIGMDDETIARAFEPFFTTKPTGSGLGLSTVYGIVAQSGGQIEIDSRLWHGSTFRVLLPSASVEQEMPTPEVPPSAVETGCETILVVDDEEAVLDVVSTMLERLGYSVLRAASPEECLRVEAEHPGAIDLLLTDIVMPGGNGEELARAITRRRPGIAVLFMSGYADPEIADARLGDDAEMFLGKPFGTEELIRKVHRALAARPAPAAARS